MPPSPPSSEGALAAQLPPGLSDLLSGDAAAALASALPDARRRLGPRGLDHLLRGLAAMARMGRGDGVQLAWVQAVPLVARDLGDEIIPDLATACLGYASRTSGAVIERVLLTAPVAARRLGDVGLFRAWLAFVDHLLARAPRGLRPMLDHLDDLLGVLTLGGLRRWADWGAEAHRTDYPELARYFALETPESRAIVQRERKGTLLVDMGRRLGMYLRALWGRTFVLVPTAGDHEQRDGARPFAEGGALHLPDALDDWRGLPGLDLYRAQAAHLAAHLAVLRAAIPGDGLSALQMLCVGLIEDARAEALAIARFPRLRDLWLQFHTAPGDGLSGVFDAVARALLVPDPPPGDSLPSRIRARFDALDLTDLGASRALGLALAGALRDRPFSAWRDRPTCPYRCDNRLLWDFEELDDAPDSAAAPEQLRKYVSVSEMVNEVEVETAGDDAQEIWVQAAEFFDDDGSSFNSREGKERLAAPVTYPEYDHTRQMLRPDWVTVREVHPRLGDPVMATRILADHTPVTRKLRHLLEAMRPQGVLRIRKLEDGDDLDLNAAVAAAIDIRQHRQPDARVMMRHLRRTRDTAVMVLLDLSESTNDPTSLTGQTVLDLTRQACVLLAEAIHRVGDSFALHGFNSDGRANVFYRRFKDFDQPWGDQAKARLAGASGALSTRMGAAIRHATMHLGKVSAQRRLMLVITDGAPADVDVRDPAWLPADTRAAVQEAGQRGIVPFCLTLDPMADRYCAGLFGARNVMVLDRVERLPEKLPLLYAALTR